MEIIDISVIIVTYNHSKYFRESIESVINQKCDFNIEIIVADDASKDGTQKIITDYQNKFQNIYPIFQQINVGTTRNLCDAFLKCRGKYITCLAGDDYWIDTNKLNYQLNWLKAYQDYIGVSHVVESRDDEKNVLGYHPKANVHNKTLTPKDYLRLRHYSTGSTLFKNIFHDKKGEDYIRLITSNRLVEDVSLGIILLNEGKIHVSDKVMSVYRTGIRAHGSNYNSSVSIVKKFEDSMSLYNENEQFFKKYDFSYMKLIQLSNFFLWALIHKKLGVFFKEIKKQKLKVKLFFIPFIVYSFVKKTIKHVNSR